MLTLFSIIIIFIILSALILILNFLISIKSLKNREKILSFECGFDPLSVSRILFSIQFFIISLTF